MTVKWGEGPGREKEEEEGIGGEGQGRGVFFVSLERMEGERGRARCTEDKQVRRERRERG